MISSIRGYGPGYQVEIGQSMALWDFTLDTSLITIKMKFSALFRYSFVNFIVLVHIKAKQPESSDLCGNITSFGVAEGSPLPAFAIQISR